MLRIPAGSFSMEAQESVEGSRGNERPVHPRMAMLGLIKKQMRFGLS
jgi:hypothetical protein